MGYSQVAVITLLATFILPIFLGWCCVRLNQYLHSRYFEPRFGLAIAAKHQELRQKYPLAYD
jgi:hypothetical protein